jgi:hypothetical protein
MKQPIGRVLDPQWAKGRKLSFHNFKKFTLGERLKILCGANLVVSSQVFTQHSPGQCATGAEVRVTKAVDPKDPQLAAFLKLEEDRGELKDLPTADQFKMNAEIKEAAKKIEEKYAAKSNS